MCLLLTGKTCANGVGVTKCLFRVIEIGVLINNRDVGLAF